MDSEAAAKIAHEHEVSHHHAELPIQQIPTTPVFGSVTSRRHAKLLHHLFEDGGGNPARNSVASPPASTLLDSSPDCAAAKNGSVVQIMSTPSETAVAAENRKKPASKIPPLFPVIYFEPWAISLPFLRFPISSRF